MYALLLLGCVLRAPELVGIEVDHVEVQDPESFTLSFIFGATWGSAVLVVHDTEGELHHVPVRYGGPSAGVLLACSPPMTHPALHFGTNKREFELSVPSGTRGYQLLGLYRGQESTAALVYVGRSWRRMRNRHSVHWAESGPATGIAAWTGRSWLWMRPAPMLEREPEESEPADQP